MRSALLSAIFTFVAVASATKTTVKSANAQYDLIYSDTYGYVNAKYNFDFGYRVSNNYLINEESKLVRYSAALGLYSNLDLYFNINLFGYVVRNFRLEVIPFTFNPFNISASWTHPIAVSQGADMSGLINFGFDWNLGNLQLKQFASDLVPKVSILDHLITSSKLMYPLWPGKNAKELQALLMKDSAPTGWAWSQENHRVWVNDPYLHFNVINWFNKVTDYSVPFSGQYINTVDLFEAYNQEMGNNNSKEPYILPE